MFARVVLAVLLTIVLYGIYSYIQVKQENFINYGLVKKGFEYEEVADPEPKEADYAPREIASGGPNTPSARPTGEPVIVPEEVPYDPSEQLHEESSIPERLRHPERVYSPGISADSPSIAEESGVASSAEQQVNRAFTVFSPEFAQNGGAFMNSVTAFDTEVPYGYSEL